LKHRYFSVWCISFGGLPKDGGGSDAQRVVVLLDVAMG
jgi:hypothetical protein